MLASPRNSGRQGIPVAKTSGFTLVELLTVIAIIMILAGIVVGVQRGVYSSQANAKARAEIQAIATAVEQYKAQYGTYPRISNNSGELYQHLIGERYSKFTPSSTPNGTGSWSNVGTEGNARPVIDASRMTVAKTGTARFVDPWGSDYIYVYNPNPPAPTQTNPNPADPNGFGDHFFVLYSPGPDKAARNESREPATHASQKGYFTGTSEDDIVFGLEYAP